MRSSRSFVPVVFLAALAAACSSTGGSNEENARASGEVLEAVKASRRATLRGYFAAERAKRQVVMSTTTRAGQDLDWVIRDSAWPAGVSATPPPQPTDIPADVPSPQGLEDDEQGPAGTVPILRMDTDAFLNRIDPPPTVEDFLSRYGAITPPSSAAHYHVHAIQLVSNIGTDGALQIFSPAVANNEFSIGQFWVQDFTNGSVFQSIESGWQKFHNLYGDNNPHLFIYYTTNNYTSDGNNIGGYNTLYTGWGQWTNKVYPGATLAASTEMYTRVELYGGCWWIWTSLVADWLGCYPASLFGTSGLGVGAHYVKWGGEVFQSGTTTTTTDMGSGAYASASGAARVRNIRYQDPAPSYAMHDYNPGIFESDDPQSQCYTGASHFLSGTGDGSYFYYGGPGYNPPNCN